MEDVTIDERTTLTAVTVDASNGESLSWRVAAQGAQPVFALAQKGEGNAVAVRRSDDFPGHPKGDYQWQVVGPGKPAPNPMDVSAGVPVERYGLRFGFIAAIGYVLLVRQEAKDGSLRQVVKDITYSAEEPTATYQEFLKVTWI